ncbi:MAG: hypothetical protein Q7S76_03115, partial [bacterium]|nr:hypothetical protein [bacterium]
NTDKQSCDTCSSDTLRVTGTNTCQKLAPVVKKAENAPAQTTSVVKTPGVKKVVTNETSISPQATTSIASTTPPKGSIWNKILGWFNKWW